MAMTKRDDCGHLYSDKRHLGCPKCQCPPTPEEIKPANKSELQFIEAAAKNGEQLTLEEARKQIKKIGTITAITLLSLFGGCVALVSSRGGGSYANGEYKEFDYVQARSMCSFIMKDKLRDPGSLHIEDVVITSTSGHLGTASIKYRAKNGFGGTNRSAAICKKYEDAAGTVRLKVTM